MRILFQGDSITDAGRDWSNDLNLGKGYPMLVEAELGYLEPNEHTFINKGISGNRIVDVYARIRRDIINYKPDVMSLLIGVNDVWHELGDSPNGVDAEKFYRVYKMLIDEIKEALPNIKIMILEPFVLKACSTEEHWDFFLTEVKKRAEKARQIAKDFDLPFIELQAGFDELAKKAPGNYWLGDGVHPTPKGHEFIKRQWLKTYNEMVK